jgi:hypothetical protein
MMNKFINIIFSLNLEERTFKTYDFYRERQEFITPAGLAFFQADWDESVKEFFHKTLGKSLTKILALKLIYAVCSYGGTDI